MNRWSGIGVMTGTSMDGVDLVHAAFIRSDAGWRFEVLHSDTGELTVEWKKRLSALPMGSAEAYAEANVAFGKFLATHILKFIEATGAQPQFVACHGQTIFHQPARGFTAQIGDGETIAAHLDVPVVTNFRAKDVALGGQGAPLVPFGEKFLFSGFDYFLNLGGFANISKGGIAYDVCPCNLPLNQLASLADPSLSFDRDGTLAASGNIHADLLAGLEALPFYQSLPPKSLGTEWLNSAFMPVLSASPASASDQLRTLTEHIALRICAEIPAEDQETTMLVTGGGALNSFLMSRLRELLSTKNVRIPDADRNLVEYKEALVFAFLGLMTLLGETNVLKSVTGASRDVCGGSIHLPPGGGYRFQL